MGRSFTTYHIVQVHPDKSEHIIHTQTGKERAIILMSLFEQRFVIDTKIQVRLNLIDEEEGKELLNKTDFKLIER